MENFPKFILSKWFYKSHPKEFSKRIFYLMFSKNTFQKDKMENFPKFIFQNGSEK